MAKPLDYGTLEQLLDVLFKNNERIHSDLRPWLKRVGEHISNPKAVVVDWPPIKDAIRKLLTEMRDVIDRHMDIEKRCESL